MEQLNFFSMIGKKKEELKTSKDFWNIVSWFEDMKALDPSKTDRNNKLQQGIDYFTAIACTLEALENNREKGKEQDRIIYEWGMNKINK